MQKLILNDLPGWQLGYIAGIIDGEGTVTVTYAHGSRYRVMVSVMMTHELVVRTLCDVTTVGTVCFIKRPQGKPLWAWQVSSNVEALTLLRPILPYLIIKRERAELAIQYCEKHVLGLSCHAEDEALYTRMKELNRR